MIQEFANLLPENVLQLVRRIETFAKKEISVKIDHRPVSVTQPNPDCPACSIDEFNATIFVRPSRSFPPQGVLHELLHIERYWVERVPQVLPLSGTDPTGERILITSKIENCLEHLVIVPREKKYGYDPFEYWNTTDRQLWERYPSPWIKDAWTRRMNFFFLWLGTSELVTDPAVNELAKQCLKQELLWDQANSFVEEVKATIHSKPHAISVVLRHLQIPRGDVELITYDGRAGKRRRVNLP